MTFKLFIVVAFLGACVLQVDFADSADQEVKVSESIDSLTNKAVKASEEVSVLITNKVNDSVHILNKLKHRVLEHVNQTIDVMRRQLTAIIAYSKELIKPIISKALELKIDIMQCVSDHKTRLLQVFKSLLTDEASCITKEVNEALSIVNESINIIKNAMSTITSLPGKLTDCNASVKCIGSVVIDKSNLQLHVPATISKIIFNATKRVSGIHMRLQVCAGVQLGKAGIETAKIVASTTKCAFKLGVTSLKTISN